MDSVCAPPRVTAALILLDNSFFVAQRPAHKSFGLYWEFPGGKAEEREKLEDALAREIREELCWNIRVGGLFRRVSCRTESLRIDLFAYWCTVESGELCLKEHVDFQWAPVDELRHLRFTEADRQLLPFLEELYPTGG